MLDPELRALNLARIDLAEPMLAAARSALAERRRAAAQRTDTTGVSVDAGNADGVAVRIYRGAPAPAPAVVYCHAGAFVLGDLDTDHRACVELARRGRCAVISVDYRLAPEHRCPAALDDALTVLRWVAARAGELGVDPGRLAVAGSSAGAALAAGLAQLAAEDAAPRVLFQLLHQPVLDERATPSKTRFAAAPAFDGAAADLMWRHYLGAADPSAPAVPARRRRLDDLVAAFISCAQLDPLRDEAVDYAVRLLDAGVATELHLFPGTCHGFDALVPDSERSQQLFALQGAALRRAFAVH
ncbi:alpha/beta hydrolase [Mycolicibacillus parakoreensis]|nr:alpha/beta hydrolase [Mycolicibacillus parakoreensis]